MRLPQEQVADRRGGLEHGASAAKPMGREARDADRDRFRLVDELQQLNPGTGARVVS